MKRGTGQRILIWVLAAIMLVGTLGTFLVMILANENDQRQSARVNQLESEYRIEQAEYEEKVAAQAEELSEQYATDFVRYQSRVSSFDADAVSELQTRDLVEGSGTTLNEDSNFTAYYIGWNPEGNVFDSSINDDDTLKAPIRVAPGSVITGWSEGVQGMKVGGVRELTIPADMAYGESGSGELIPPNTPLKFVIMVIPEPEQIPEPEIPDELLQHYMRQF